MAYYFARFMSWLCCRLSDRVSDRVGLFLGRLTWPFIPARRRRMAVENVSACLGAAHEEAARIAKASWVRFGPMLFEVMRFPVLKPRFLEMAEIEGAAYLWEGLSLGRGAVIASAHSGNWELMGGVLAAAGFPTVGVAMRQKEAGFDRFINEYRRGVGMHVTYKDNVREMFALLKKGWAIGLLMDQDSDHRSGIVFDWFGRPTNFVQGPAALARHQNAPIVPGYIHRLPDGRHRVLFYPPIFVERTKDKAADIRRAMEAVSRTLEQHIRRYPEEWFWLHDRWKSQRD